MEGNCPGTMVELLYPSVYSHQLTISGNWRWDAGSNSDVYGCLRSGKSLPHLDEMKHQIPETER